MDDPYGGVETRGETLPLQCMVEESVAVVEGYIEGMGGLPFLPSEEICLGCREIACPEEAGIVRLQPQDTGEGVLLEVGGRWKGWIK